MPARDLTHLIDPDGLDGLLEALRRRGFTPIGPRVRQGAICYDEVDSAADLPAGWTDVQEGGTYRLEQRGDEALFGHNVGPNSWKSHLFPSRLTLWKARRSEEEGLEIDEQPPERPRYAFIGVRSCDLHAIAVQDRTFLEGPWADDDYGARREGAFIVAVNCGQAGGTCFCVSMEHRARGRPRDSTWPSPSCSTRRVTASWSRSGASAAPSCWARSSAGPPRRTTTSRPRPAVSERAASQMGRSSTPRTSGTSSTATASTRAGTRWPTAA